MKRIYKNETKLRLLVDTKCDLSGYEDVTLCLRKPDDSVVSFAASSSSFAVSSSYSQSIIFTFFT